MAEEKKEAKKESLTGHDFWVQFARELFITHGLPWLHSIFVRDEKARHEDQVARTRNKHYFAAAMVQLRLRDDNAADIIEHFNEHYLDNDTDREDFQHNAAKVGGDEDGKMGDTVEFLWQLAQLPNHPFREVRLVALGFIGARSIDAAERAKEFLVSVGGVLKGLPADAQQKLEEGIRALKDLDNKQWMQKAETSSAAFRKTAADRLAAYKARRRS